jgi:cellulose synthase operon protein C
MSFNRIILASLLAAVGVGTAIACGPDFPWQLLGNRDRTVSDRVELNFAFEVGRLVKVPVGGARAVEPDKPEEVAPAAVERQEAESGAWRNLMEPATLDDVVARLDRARQANDGGTARAASIGLPAAVRDYLAGAAEYGAGRYEEALGYFQAIERLPPEQRRIRSVAAAYMIGRTNQQLGDFAAARAAFPETRRLADAGAPDPMGLAVASLGEQARIDIFEAGLVEAPWPDPDDKPDDAAITRLIANAVGLYAEQAARGSKMALLSLGEVARRLAADPRTLSLVVTDPLVRRLLVAYVTSQERGYYYYGPDDETDAAARPAIVRVMAAVLSEPAPAPGPDLDRLAAFAYQAGRYDQAERLVANASQPLGLWVRAKLALRRGDRAAAVRDWTAAFAANQPGGERTLDEESDLRLRGELAVMRLSQGEYGQSLQLLFPVATTYWGDLIYVAERVLTVDELKAFVDGLPPPRPPAANDDNAARSGWVEPVPSLRALLARRLVRLGRVSEAIPYFPPALPSEKTQERDGNSANQDDARDYLAAVEATRAPSFEWPWQKVSRAEALFQLATLSRQQGMGLMGTEGPPDEQVLAGMYAYGFGQASPNGWRKAPSALLGPDEPSRFAASAPRPDSRYHYRGVAADRAAAAADLLPQRSQAYAATLCWAAAYAIQNGDQAKADGFYRRYIANGAYQAWAKDFGQTCPDPDFDGARNFWWRQIKTWFAAKAASVWRHIGLVLGAAIGVALLAALIRRSRTTANRHS